MRACLRFSAPHRQRAETRAEEDTLTLTTLHNSKGLEFPVALLVGLQLLEPRKEEDLAEEMRLLYVGMTRATHELHLSAGGPGRVVEMVEAAIGRLQKPWPEPRLCLPWPRTTPPD